LDDAELRSLDEAEMASAGLWLRMAGGRLAVEYLERARRWAADVDPGDQGIVLDLEQIRLRLLNRLHRLEEMSALHTGDAGEDAGCG
jgi:hypothetical protein